MAGSKNNYFYNASTAAAYIFSILFGIILLLHIFQTFKYRTWFIIILIIAIFLEFFGYVTRVVSIKQPDITWANIVSQTFIIVAPAFVAAQDYMIVGRIMAYVGSEYALIKHTRITKIFVAADVFAILTQGMGGAILAGANGNIDHMKNAKNILLGGLALQVITFGFFLFVAIAFHVRSNRAPALKPFGNEMRRLQLLWLAFYVSGILITLRSIYRTIEFGEVNFTPGENDPQGYVITHEWPFYVFDAVPIFFSILALAIFHPGMYLPSKKGTRVDGGFEEQPGSRKYLCCGPRKEPTRHQRMGDSEVALAPVYRA